MKPYYAHKEKVTFEDIVFKTLDKILEVSSCEFREGYWQETPVKMGSGTMLSKTYIEDKRDSYINLVDFLHDILLPHFDKEMNEKDEKLKKESNEKKGTHQDTKNAQTLWMNDNLKFHRALFQELNVFLAKKDYFKQEAYGTDDIDDMEEPDD